MDALLILAPMPLEKGTIIGSSVSVLGLCTLFMAVGTMPPPPQVLLD